MYSVSGEPHAFCRPATISGRLWLLSDYFWTFTPAEEPSHFSPRGDLVQSYKRVRLDKIVAPYSRPTTSAIVPLHECNKVHMQRHAQKPYSIQGFAHESRKVGGRGKREEEREERQRPGGWWVHRIREEIWPHFLLFLLHCLGKYLSADSRLC